MYQATCEATYSDVYHNNYNKIDVLNIKYIIFCNLDCTTKQRNINIMDIIVLITYKIKCHKVYIMNMIIK